MRKIRHEQNENLDRWLISYADFITLLFAFFVVMYAISSVNEGKYRVLSDSLEAAFDTPPKSLYPVQVGIENARDDLSIIKLDNKSNDKVYSSIEQLKMVAESSELTEIEHEFEQAVMPQIEDDMISVKRDELWVEVEINTKLLFTSGEAELEDDAIPVLQKLAGVLKKYPNSIQVEGFTDNLPINTFIFPSNWELSAARAASVVHLFMKQGVAPERMVALGFGEYRPVADNATHEGRQKNRRVVLVVLADDKARRAIDIQRSRLQKITANSGAE